MKPSARRAAATLAVALAARLIGSRQRDWAAAMKAEVWAIEADPDALLFALGCLRAAILDSLRSNGASSMKLILGRFSQPQAVGLLCALAAVAVGIIYLLAAGAPSRLIVVNLLSFVLAVAVFPLGASLARRFPNQGGIIVMLAALALLATALLGTAVEGASRWVVAGPLALQPSLILLPLLLVLFARSRDLLGTCGVVIAAAALALQPDRAMAAVMVAALATLFAIGRGRGTLIALAVAIAAFAATLLRPDSLPAQPYVDRILFSSFAIHPLMGACLWLGGALLAAPAVAAARRGLGDAPAWAAFGAAWLAIFLASALSDYPTPLVGYGGSAILGYLLSLAFTGTSAIASAARPEVENGTAEASPDTFSERRFAAA